MQVADLRPEGPLHRTVTTVTTLSHELQFHFSAELRRQYLHELFPDLSVEANFEEEPDHHQLMVPRDEFQKESCPVSLSADVTRCDSLCIQGHGLQVLRVQSDSFSIKEVQAPGCLHVLLAIFHVAHGIHVRLAL